MKIAVDLLPFGLQLAGTGVYVRNLLEYFGKLEPMCEFHLFMQEEAKSNFIYSDENYYIHTYKFKNKMDRILFEQIKFIAELQKYKIDKLFVPSVVKPIFYQNDTTITIHDMIPYKIKNKYSFSRTIYIKIMTYLSAITAEKIITVSKASKDDLKEIYSIEDKKITVIYNGLDFNKVFKSLLDKDGEVLQKFGVRDRYVLYVGTIEPGKNLINTIKAFNILLNILPKEEKNLQLILVGKKTEYYMQLEKLIINEKSMDVIFTDFVSDTELSILYKKAELFIYISFYEGFGLPVLEAMGNGIPVITSNVSSLPEIVGENGCCVDPYNIEAIACMCAEILTNIKVKNILVHNQYQQLNKFNWKESAKKSLNIILK